MSIITYDKFIEKQIIEFIDYSINESVDIKSLWDKTVNKIKNLSNDAKLRVTKHLIASLLTFNTSANLYNMIQNSSADLDTKNVAIELLNKENDTPKDVDNWKKGYEFSISKKGINHIKQEEKLRLKAYDIGDGMITIGYGHAEPMETSKYKLGDKISEKQADRLLKEDLKEAEDGIKRIFKEWEERKIDVRINQNMYDALVSIVFNSGIGGVRMSDFIKDIKKGKFEEAGEKIKKFNISSKFPGLAYRRSKESKLFLNSI